MVVASHDELVEYLRCARGFDAEAVLDVKVGRLAAWFASEGLDAAVVGVSGGIDSAVVLGLLQRAASRPGAALARVIALVAPIDRPGATGQQDAERRGVAVARACGAEVWSAPFGAVQDEAVAALEAAADASLDGWTAGQLLSVMRTPLLYGAAALLQAAGHRSVVVGTTNRDEGAYLGFFGKASDGMVDLQPISDLHKSEVRAIASLLAVPAEVISAAPAGDVWDGRDDAAMIGASYDEVEVVLRLRELGLEPSVLAADLVDGARLLAASKSVDRLHATNAHKYRVGSPAVHLDVLPRGIPGGWSDTVLAPRSEQRPPAGQLAGEWEPRGLVLSTPVRLPTIQPVQPVQPIQSPAIVTDDGAEPPDAPAAIAVVGIGVLDDADCERLIDVMHQQAPLEPVGVTGYRARPARRAPHQIGGVPDAGRARAVAGSESVAEVADAIGSDRGTAWSPELAAQLWARVRPLVRSVRVLGPFDPTDGHALPGRAGHRSWRVVGLSPVLRFMRYRPGGHHLCHYDAGFDYGDGRRSLLSLVIYLTGAGDPGSGGATRFVRDGQQGRAVWDRDHEDWALPTDPEDVIAAVEPRRGSVLVFDHRRCHDVERWEGPGERVVIRGDVVYEAIPDGCSFP